MASIIETRTDAHGRETQKWSQINMDSFSCSYLASVCIIKKKSPGVSPKARWTPVKGGHADIIKPICNRAVKSVVLMETFGGGKQ